MEERRPRWQIILAAACTFALVYLSGHPEFVFRNDPEGLMALGWTPTKVCFRWSPPECFGRWTSVLTPKSQTPDRPPETALCHYGSAANDRRCDERFGR
jgi:hypothetical protein